MLTQETLRKGHTHPRETKLEDYFVKTKGWDKWHISCYTCCSFLIFEICLHNVFHFYLQSVTLSFILFRCQWVCKDTAPPHHKCSHIERSNSQVRPGKKIIIMKEKPGVIAKPPLLCTAERHSAQPTACTQGRRHPGSHRPPGAAAAPRSAQPCVGPRRHLVGTCGAASASTARGEGTEKRRPGGV